MNQHRPRLATLMILLAMLQFACMDALSKYLTDGYPILQVMWFRTIAFSLLTTFLLGRAGLAQALKSTRPGLQAATALLLVVEGSIFVLALKYMPLADAHALGAMSPLAVVALSAVWLRERVDLGRWMAVAAGCAGVLVILRPGFQDLNWAASIPLACVAMWAVYQILSRQCSQADGSKTTMAWTAFTGLAFCTLTLPWNWVTPTPAAAGLIVATATLGAGALFCFIKALDLAEASFLQPFVSTVLVWVTVLSIVVFGDIPDGWTVLGAAIIVSGGLYAWHRETRAGGSGAGLPQAAA